MPSDNSPQQVDKFTKSANGKTAGSYFTDGRWNIGGWSTYPSADAVFTNAAARPLTPNPDNPRK